MTEKYTRRWLLDQLEKRPGVNSDVYTTEGVPSEYRYIPLGGTRIMDVGANIGAFSVWAAAQGSEVYAYEPEPENYALFLRNTARYTSVIGCQAALTNDPPGTHVPFYMTPGGSRASGSTTHFRGRTESVVVTRNFARELERVKPDAIKMDCEGGEWSLLLENDLPMCVRDIAIEVHFTKRHWREQLYTELCAKFADWEAVKPPRNTGSNRHCLVHWRRA